MPTKRIVTVINIHSNLSTTEKNSAFTLLCIHCEQEECWIVVADIHITDLQKVMKKKLKNLFYVKADTKTDKKGNEYFHFNKAEIYEKPSFEKFWDLIDKGLIMYDIRIGSYQSGIKIWKSS